MSKTYRLRVWAAGWEAGTIVTECAEDPTPSARYVLVECQTKGSYKHGSGGYDTQPEGMWGAYVSKDELELVEEAKPVVHSVTAVPEVSITRKRLTIDKIGVGQTFIIHGQPETVYVKISNSHVFNHKRLQMHTTVAERFKQHLNLVAVELVVYNGK